MSDERGKYPIPGWEGLYSITKDGRVWSHERVVNGPICPIRKRGRWIKAVKNAGDDMVVSLCRDGTKKVVKLHRLLGITFLGLEPGQEIDHISRNREDNRLSNLRVCTRAQNTRNVPSRRGSSSKYRGVHFNKRARKWRAVVVKDGKQHFLGYFTEELAALVAYDTKARELFGEFYQPQIPCQT